MSSQDPVDAAPDLYSYEPSIPLAMAGAACVIIVTLVHMWQLVLHPASHFWAMYIGLFMECIGFGARALSVRNPTDPNSFVVSYLALILAPSFVAAACYATFGRIVWWVTPPEDHRIGLLWFPTRFVTPLFVLFDLGSFFIQLLGAGAVGAAYSSKTLAAHQRQEKASTGLTVLRAGLGLQMVCFGAFAIIGIRFLLSRLNWTVNVSAMAIMGRAVYRLIEFSGSRSRPSYVLLHEWPFWTFDALPMLGVFILFVVTHPGRYLPPEFLCLRLSKRKLRNIAESSPPSYIQASFARVDDRV